MTRLDLMVLIAAIGFFLAALVILVDRHIHLWIPPTIVAPKAEPPAYPSYCFRRGVAKPCAFLREEQEV